MTMSTPSMTTQVHRFLCSPNAYPDNPVSVQVKETHASWLYITDRFVYKQKKPVSFEFLDFSTLEKREHYCREELMLNRRFSSNVYLRLVPVSLGPGGQLQCKAGDNIVEWLVKMTRLDDSQNLESLIRGSQLSPLQLTRLADRLSSIYIAQAPTVLRSEDYLRQLHRHVRANQNDLLVELPADSDRINYVTSAQQRFLALNSELLNQRVADGRVVDGHGDLRPEHIYFHLDSPQMIDCIEFSPEYRNNDVIDELAFLAMECDRLGAAPVGRAILGAYRETSGDECTPRLASFYKSYRACVRAKIAILRGHQQNASAGEQESDIARNYLQLAEGYADKFAPKLLIAVGGLSGTGKSTLAASLQNRLQADLLQTDVVRRELFASESSNEKYSAAKKQKVYDELLSRAARQFKQSPTVILDGTFTLRETRNRLMQFAKQLGAKLIQVECECPIEIAKQRILRRQSDLDEVSEATPNVLERQAFNREPPLQDVPTVYVDTARGDAPKLDSVLMMCND